MPNKKLLDYLLAQDKGSQVDYNTGLTEREVQEQEPLNNIPSLRQEGSLKGQASTKFDISSYKDYFPEGSVFISNIKALDAARASNQSTGAQALGFLTGAAAEVVGGTIEGIGYLGDLTHWIDKINGGEGDWNNWMSDFGKSIKGFTSESLPIYEEAPGTFNMWDPAWWAKNGVSVASSLSLLIPATGVVRGIGMLGKAMGFAGKMGKTAQWMTTGIGQAVASRYMENVMEATQTFDEEYQKLIDHGIEEPEAKQRAGDAASFVFKANWAMLAQDIPQYLMLARGPKLSKAVDDAALAAAAGTSKTGALVSKYGRNLGNMVSEGFEEAYQFVVAEEAKYFSDVKAGIADESGFSERLKDYVKDGEMHTAAFFGALGAGVMHAVGKPVMNYFKNKDELSEAEIRIREVKGRTEVVSRNIKNLKEAVQREDQGAIDQAKMQMATELGVRGAAVGNFDLVMANIDQLIKETSAEEKSENGLDESMGKELEEVKNNITKAAKLYQKAAKKYDPAVASSVVQLQMLNEHYNGKLNTVNDTILEATNNFPRVNELSPEGRQVFDKSLEKLTKERYVETLEEIVDKFEGISPSSIEMFKKTIQQNKQDIANLSGEIATDELNINATDKTVLQGLNTISKDFIIEAKSEKMWLQDTIARNIQDLETYTSKEGQAKVAAKIQAIIAQQKKDEADKQQQLEDEKNERQEEEVTSSINTSRDQLSTEEVDNEEDVIAAQQQTQGKSIKDMSIEELDNILNSSVSEDVKTAVRKEKENRENIKTATKVVRSADIIETVGAAEPQTPSNGTQEEYKDANYAESANELIAETGYALAWRSTTGLDAIEIADNFDDIENAQALSEFLEDPSIDKTKFTLEFYIDKERLRGEKELDHIYKKFDKTGLIEDLTAEELGILPVRAYIVNEKGDKITKNGKEITTAVHDTTFGQWEKLDPDKRKAAQEETLNIKEKVLTALLEGKTPVANIEGQRSGILITEVKGTKFKDNNLAEATGMEPSKMKLVVGDVAPAGSTSSRFINSDKTIVEELDQYRSATPGAVYLIIPTANGSSFPLRTFVDNLTSTEANLVYDIYAKTMENPNAYKENVGKHPDLMRTIKDSGDDRVKQLADITNISKITLADLLKLLVYEGQQTKTSGKGALFSAKNSMHVAGVNMTKEMFLSPEGKREFLKLIQDKRRQISLSQLGNTAYKDYLVSNGILTTNATNVNGVMFKAPTTIFGEIKAIDNSKEVLEKAELPTEIITEADRTAEDYQQVGEIGDLNIDELDRYSGTSANKQGAINTQNANEVEDMGNALDLDAFNDLISQAENKYKNEDYEDFATKVRKVTPLSPIDRLASSYNISTSGFFSPQVHVGKLRSEAASLGYSVEKASSGSYYLKKANGKMYKPSQAYKTQEIEGGGTLTQAEIEAVAKMVPDHIAIQVVEDYIRLLDGGQSVVGLFQAGLIRLSKMAQAGDGYHEAFHAVFRTMLSEEQQRELLDEARNLFSPLESDIHILMKRHTISREKATDLFYEEQLADEFGIYASNPNIYEFRKEDAKRKNLFERLLAWVKNILGVTGNIEKMFKKIQQGKFSKIENVDVLIQAGIIKSINDKTGKPC